MNERAKQLALQALKHPDNDNDGLTVFDNDELKKFAELIVKECTGIVENLSPGYDDYRDQIENAFRRDCIDEMKQHFGIEE